MRELALFAGTGGGILGGLLLGWRTRCAVEINPYCRKVLLARQRDGILEPFPIWDDIRTFDGRPWRGYVDVVSGGFPCQDISCAGKGAGIRGERSGLWVEMARVIREVRPKYVFVENSPMLTSRGLGDVLEDLAAMGFNAQWGVLGAIDAGAPHIRKRIWIVADASACSVRLQSRRWPGKNREETPKPELDGEPQYVANANIKHDDIRRYESSEVCRERSAAAKIQRRESGWWSTEPDVGRVAHGVADRVDRLRAIGNGQVPAVVALAWGMLK